MKVIPRWTYDRVMLNELDMNMNERNNIIRLISLNHDQLSSETFRRIIQYAWYASGYTDTDSRPFKTGAEICFSLDVSMCVVSSCDAATFICCSWCQKPLRFTHFPRKITIIWNDI